MITDAERFAETIAFLKSCGVDATVDDLGRRPVIAAISNGADRVNNALKAAERAFSESKSAASARVMARALHAYADYLAGIAAAIKDSRKKRR